MTNYKRITFDGKFMDANDMTHQHVSNTYWFDKIHNGKSDEDLKFILDHLDEKFDGIVLAYKPLKRFYGEIGALFVNKQLEYDEWDKYNIIFENKVVGYIDLRAENDK